MQDLLALAEKVAELLKARHETVVIAESSSGGLISAALLGVPGASEYFLGGAVVYTLAARRNFLDLQDAALAGIRAASEPYALLVARTARERFAATWSVSETGSTGPTGNRYGDPAGQTCMAVAGPVERVLTLRTGSAERMPNMRHFAAAALELLLESIKTAPARA